VSESYNVSVIFHTAICSLLSVMGGSSTAVDLPLELDTLRKRKRCAGFSFCAL
jgi:hypothetical protein